MRFVRTPFRCINFAYFGSRVVFTTGSTSIFIGKFRIGRRIAWQTDMYCLTEVIATALLQNRSATISGE